MGSLDPIRAPEKARFFISLTVGVAVVMGLIVSLSWWLQAPLPRVLIVLVISAAIGLVAGRMMFRRKRK